MTQQHESRWTLASTGNRIFLAVVVGLVVSWLASLLELHGTTRVVVFALVAALTYAVATVLRPSRR